MGNSKKFGGAGTLFQSLARQLKEEASPAKSHFCQKSIPQRLRETFPKCSCIPRHAPQTFPKCSCIPRCLRQTFADSAGLPRWSWQTFAKYSYIPRRVPQTFAESAGLSRCLRETFAEAVREAREGRETFTEGIFECEKPFLRRFYRNFVTDLQVLARDAARRQFDGVEGLAERLLSLVWARFGDVKMKAAGQVFDPIRRAVFGIKKDYINRKTDANHVN